MIQRRSISWGSLLGGVGLILLGLTLLIDQADHFLPEIIQRYWAVLLIAAGVWNLIARLRFREDAWAGMDYGTGLYVIRHRRQRRTSLWIVSVLFILGAFFLWAGLTPSSQITIGPIVAMILGISFILRSFL
jgi:cell wall-active antibiotic response 4TMS protein YvqF